MLRPYILAAPRCSRRRALRHPCLGESSTCHTPRSCADIATDQAHSQVAHRASNTLSSEQPYSKTISCVCHCKYRNNYSLLQKIFKRNNYMTINNADSGGKTTSQSPTTPRETAISQRVDFADYQHSIVYNSQ